MIIREHESATNNSFHGAQPISPDILENSWIEQAGKVPPDILTRLSKSPIFQRYVGLSLLAQSPDTISPKDSKGMWSYVANGFSATDAMLNRQFWTDYQRGHSYIPPSITISAWENMLTAEIKLRTLLLTQLLNLRGLGLTVESMAEKLIRYGELIEKAEGLVYEAGTAETARVFIKRANGEIFSPGLEQQREARYWNAEDWAEALLAKKRLNRDDQKELSRQFQTRTNPQPFCDDNGRLYIHIKGLTYKPDDTLQKETSKWDLDDWVYHLEKYIAKTHEIDEIHIAKEIKAGRQPFARVDLDVRGSTPWDAIPYFGVQLRALSHDAILSLANGGCCDPTCQMYHGFAQAQKELGELIAPVDTKLFAGELLESYQLWLKKRQPGDKFRVLIPAQADETTILGIIDHLSTAGITTQELKQNFSLVLADLCPTPLLSIYAHLRARDLLGIANIVSMDVFNWTDPLEETFHFVATDHFIDLFPPSGEFNQKEVFLALIRSLAPNGKLVLTARCGTEGRTLTREVVMNEFYTRCQQQIEKLTDELERADNTEGEAYSGVYSSIFPTKQHLARGIYALIVYLTLRDVHPLPNIKTLRTLLTGMQRDTGNSFSLSVKPLDGKKDKVCIRITKKK